MAKSNFAMIFVATIATVVFALVTWWVVDAAGGTAVKDPAYSNTPNAVVPGPAGIAPENYPGVQAESEGQGKDQGAER